MEIFRKWVVSDVVTRHMREASESTVDNRNWPIHLFLIFAAIVLLLFSILVTASEGLPSKEPILAVGHGAFYNNEGKVFTPDETFIVSAQQYYIAEMLTTLEKKPSKYAKQAKLIDKAHKLIFTLVDDRVLANALLMDQFIKYLSPQRKARLTSINDAMRYHYIEQHQRKAFTAKDGVSSKGIDPEVALRLEKEGIQVFFSTNASGRKYIEECREAGVPIPEPMFSSDWNYEGIIKDEFIEDYKQAELWSYTKDSNGVCLALPRYSMNGEEVSDDAKPLGIICLGTQSNNACFWDSPNSKTFKRNQIVGLDQFLGGADLASNGQGTCTDCHAGENPFVVHPEKAPFSGLSLQPSGWHNPLVHPSWPQNPGPTNILDAAPIVGASASPGKCNSCHQAGLSGRFPDVSTQLPGYCSVILTTAVNAASSKQTMPPSYAGLTNVSDYIDHTTALLNACKQPPSGGGVVVEVDFPDDESHISPPIIIDPLYGCATKIAIRGTILHAKVVVYINGSEVNSIESYSPNLIAVDVPALVAGDIVTATQEYNGALSAQSNAVDVRDHKVDFPAGLPAPEIDPQLIYECASNIAVRHVPGATVSVYSNGADPKSFVSSHDWTVAYPKKTPFDIGDKFTAKISLCKDESPMSEAQSAVNAPAMLKAPKFDPENVYENQELVTFSNLDNGSRTFVDEASFGNVGSFSTPINWYPDFNLAAGTGSPLSAGDKLSAYQQLCDKGPTRETPDAERCEALPAPKISQPHVGDNSVFVTESVPGARVIVYDQNAVELGDGSGTVVVLNRTLTGVDTLVVIQQLGDCRSKTGYLISVGNRGTGGGQDGK